MKKKDKYKNRNKKVVKLVLLEKRLPLPTRFGRNT